jgi:excinuclease ABC subunit C
MEPIKSQVDTLPLKPGIYVFKDKRGKVIYVGKAICLKHRVQSYFRDSSQLLPKIQEMVSLIHNLETIITDSEQQALILECNLIKKYCPRYNVMLKDDKTYPYLKIDLFNDFPGVFYTRKLKKDGCKYFGPFADASSVRKTYYLIKKIFPFRSCNKVITGKETRPCLNYHIHRCLGPCIGAIDKKDYNELIRQIILFLEGKQELIIKRLKEEMKVSSEQLKYEKSALIRDQISAIESVIEGQKIAIKVHGEMDVIALAMANDFAYVEVFFVRNNKLIGRDKLVIDGIKDEKPEQIMTDFIKQYYASASFIPKRILLQYPIYESRIIKEWMKNLKESSVEIIVPRQGAKKQLIDMVAANALQGLRMYQIRKPTVIELESTLATLKEKLNLPAIPLRIEGYDISNIRGTLSVGSMVVFEKGLPRPAHYRRFKIKTVAGIDDYSMIQEVLKRRFKNYLNKEDKWTVTPDLILIDGGKGHLNAAVEVLNELKLDGVPVASIAKENEDIFTPPHQAPLGLSKASPELHLLQRVRDEAHRFALSYHQKLRSKKNIASVLDTIPGVGPKRKKALLSKFGSVRGLKDASKDQLAGIKGITEALAETILENI